MLYKHILLLLSFTSTEVKILDFDRVLFGYYYRLKGISVYFVLGKFLLVFLFVLFLFAVAIMKRYSKI